MRAEPSPLFDQWIPSSSVFDHSIIWEDDMWRRDLHDVPTVHNRARQQFHALLDQVTVNPKRTRSRIQLFHGPSGAGKTHLMRALRTFSHSERRGYFAYAQMTSDVKNYADFYLRRIINSLEKPYDPEFLGESGLHHLSNAIVAEAAEFHEETIKKLRHDHLTPEQLSELIIDLADDIVSSSPFATSDLEPGLIRALLYLQRNDPRIDQRVRQYLKGMAIAGRSQQMVGAIEPWIDEDRSFAIIESLGRLTYAVEGSPLILCIDQVEDLRFFENAEERFQKAVRDLIQIVNRVPSAIVLISCLDDFYNSMRAFLPQSFIDRIERSKPQFIGEMRSRTEAELILQKRIDRAFDSAGVEGAPPQAKDLFGPAFFDEVTGLSTRRLLEIAHDHWLELIGEKEPEPEDYAHHDEIQTLSFMEEEPVNKLSVPENRAKDERAAPQFEPQIEPQLKQDITVQEAQEGEPSGAYKLRSRTKTSQVTKFRRAIFKRPGSKNTNEEAAAQTNDYEAKSSADVNEYRSQTLDYEYDVARAIPARPQMITPPLAEPVAAAVLEPVAQLETPLDETDQSIDESAAPLDQSNHQMPTDVEAQIIDTDVVTEHDEPVSAPEPEPTSEPEIAPRDLPALWQEFQNGHMPILPVDEAELSELIAVTLEYIPNDLPDYDHVDTKRITDFDLLEALDITAHKQDGAVRKVRLFICNRPSQGGWLRRQIEQATKSGAGRLPVAIRESEFAPNSKSTVASSVRKFMQIGGRCLVLNPDDIRAMALIRDFCHFYKTDPGLQSWRSEHRHLADLSFLPKLLGESGFMRAKPTAAQKDDRSNKQAKAQTDIQDLNTNSHAENHEFSLDQPQEQADLDQAVIVDDLPEDIYTRQLRAAEFDLNKQIVEEPEFPEGHWGGQYYDRAGYMVPKNPVAKQKSGLIRLGSAMGKPAERVTLDTKILRRHAAVLGGSGSGKTTLALTMIEQLLLEGIPVVLIDRKGDLCSYANQAVWQGADGDVDARVKMRAHLREQIDVAVYTPGRTTGRPISITLLPKGTQELPEHEQSELANLSAAALGDMLHFGTSPTHQRYSGILSVALKLLAELSDEAVTLTDLITYMEDDNTVLPEMIQRMDPNGRLRLDLVAQLDSLSHRNFALFDRAGEPLSMDSFLGLGKYGKEDKTKLSIIYTGFLGDNENILFWVAQFLSEALRFCQRNPSDALQALVMFDEADLYIPANGKPATKEPLESLLKRARSAGMGIMLATQSPGDLDYKSRDQITSWFIGKVREDTALRKLKAAFAAQSGIDPSDVLPNQKVGEFHLIQEGLVKAMKSQRSLVNADQIPFDQIEEISRETFGKAPKEQLKLDLGEGIDPLNNSQTR